METSESATAAGPDPARTELLAKLRASVAHLPDELRVATVLRFQEGLTFAAMAELAGTSEPTMFERVKRALEKLRVGLAQAGHAHALLELETLLAVEESVAVPGRLCAALLALPATATAGAAIGAATASVATASSGAWLAAAAAVVVLVGGGAAAVHVVRSSRSSSQEEARAPAGRGRAGGAEAATSAPVAAAAAEPARVADGRPADAAAARGGDGRMRAGDLLSSDMAMPPGVTWDDRMVETAHLRGVVVDDDGRPLAKARVDASSSEGAPKSFAWRAIGESGADGRFDLRVAAITPEPQPYVVVLDHDDMLRHKVNATVTPGGSTDLARVEMKRNAADRPGDFELALTVVGPEGRPVPRAIVRMFRKLVARPTGAPDVDGKPRFEWQAGGLTDERGTIVLAAKRLGEKRFEIHARAAGCRDLVVDRTVDASGASEATVALEAGLTLEGRLVAPAGDAGAAALRGARLDAIAYDAFELEASGAFAGEAFDAEISPDGSFVVRGLAPGRHRLRVYGDFSTAWVDGVEAGQRDVSLQLKRADDPSDAGLHRAEIHGRVVDERGAPLAVDLDDVDLVALPDGWKPDDPRVQTEFVPALFRPDGRQTAQRMIDGERPGPSSAFHKNGLDAGSYVVVVKAAGRKPGVSAVVTVAENQLARDVVVALHTQ